MKELFQEKKFNAGSKVMISTINAILDDYAGQGYDLTLRQLYYQLVAKNIIPNSERSYKNTGNLVSEARLAGLIDWNMISDRGRGIVRNSHWETPADIVRSAADAFQIDHWKNQPCYVEVMVEKQALEGVLIPVCRELDVPFSANKGYSSSSALYMTGKRYMWKQEDGKRLYVLYLGDHDPSGIDMTRDVTDRLFMFAGGKPVTVQRLALNMDQIEDMKPPENPAKLTDSRAEGYIKKFGKSSWELDAIEPRRLAGLVRDAITGILDMAEWERSHKKQEGMRKELTSFADNYGKKKPRTRRKRK